MKIKSPLKGQLCLKVKAKKVVNQIKSTDSRLKTIHTGWPIIFNCCVGGLYLKVRQNCTKIHRKIIKMLILDSGLPVGDSASFIIFLIVFN